jgi:hypothetical protein
MPVYTPTTWTMTAAQLITPTTSQLSVINAIQASVTACPDWTVNATGTTTTGYKWVEVKPANAQSLYADYRILFVERINASTTNRTAYYNTANGTPWNNATAVMAYFAPDGGSSWVTFTPANIEVTTAGQDVYLGTKYKYSNTSTGLQIFTTIPVACTALWLYTADGVMHIVSRQAPTSHSVTAFGNVFYQGTASSRVFNAAGTEVGVPAIYARYALGSVALNTNWFGSASTNSWLTSWFTTSLTAPAYYNPNLSNAVSVIATATYGRYESTYGTLSMTPIVYIGQGNTSMRGVYLADTLKTRTTIKDTTGATIGYTFYPDDTASGAALGAFCYMNS